jgi:transposase
VTSIKRGKARGIVRPTKLNHELQTKIVDLIRAGNYIETASSCVGVNKSTLYDWLKRGARASQKEGKIPKEELPFVDFSNAVEKAIAEAEARDVMIIANASKSDWKASAWRLERKFPNKWGRHDHIKAEVHSEHTERTETFIEHQIDTDPQTVELVRQLWRRQQILGEQYQE